MTETGDIMGAGDTYVSYDITPDPGNVQRATCNA